MSEESVDTSKKDGYYFDDDFKLSQVEVPVIQSPIYLDKKLKQKASKSPRKSATGAKDFERNIYDFEH